MVGRGVSIWCCCCPSNNETCNYVFFPSVQVRLVVGRMLRIQTPSPSQTQSKQFMAQTPLVKVTLHDVHPADLRFQQGNQSECGHIQLSSWNPSCRFPLRHRYRDSEDDEAFVHVFNTDFTRDGLASDWKSLIWYRGVWIKPSEYWSKIGNTSYIASFYFLKSSTDICLFFHRLLENKSQKDVRRLSRPPGRITCICDIADRCFSNLFWKLSVIATPQSP